MPRQITEHDVKRIYRLLDEGFSKARIARILNCSLATVKRYGQAWVKGRRHGPDAAGDAAPVR
jgi:DNA invertase Pin-like site-specific DNA recombinase